MALLTYVASEGEHDDNARNLVGIGGAFERERRGQLVEFVADRVGPAVRGSGRARRL